MQNLTYTTETIENTYGTFDQEAWEIHGYTLVRITDRNDTSEPADWRVRHDREMPDLDNMNYTGEVEYGVNWSAMGTKTSAEARSYALKLLQASEAAEIFTQVRKVNK